MRRAGTTAGLAVRLRSQPLADVWIGLRSTNESEVTVISAPQCLAAAAWNDTQLWFFVKGATEGSGWGDSSWMKANAYAEVRWLLGVRDEVPDGDQTVALVFEANSTDAHYDGQRLAVVAVNKHVNFPVLTRADPDVSPLAGGVWVTLRGGTPATPPLTDIFMIW